MNLKRIIREEINNDMEWINDIKSNKDIAEELFNQTIITKDKGIVKLPFTWTRQSPKKPYFDLSIRKKYGEDKDSDDIWERYKVLVNNRLKELTGKGIKESNDMEWIKNIQSNQDIAQEIADETKIKNKRLYAPFPYFSSLPPYPNSLSPFSLLSSFTKYCKEQYGLSEDDINDVWKRYKKLVKGKVNNINESDDLDWIKNIEPPSYDSLVGKALYFDPYIDTHQQLNSVLKVLKMLGFHYGVWADDFQGDEDEYEEIIGLYLRTDDGGITYTAYIDEDYEEHINDWVGEPVQVLDGWQTLGDFI